MNNIDFNNKIPIFNPLSNTGAPSNAQTEKGPVENKISEPHTQPTENGYLPQPDAGDLNAYWATFDVALNEAVNSGNSTWYRTFQERLPALLAAYKRDPSKGELSLSTLFAARIEAHGGDLFVSKLAKGSGPSFECAKIWCDAIEEFLDFEKTNWEGASYSLYTQYHQGIYLQAAALDMCSGTLHGANQKTPGSPREIDRQNEQAAKLFALQEEWYKRLQQHPTTTLIAYKDELLYSISRHRGVNGLSPGEVEDTYDSIEAILKRRSPHHSVKTHSECLSILHALLTTYPEVKPERGFAIYRDAIDNIDNNMTALMTTRGIKFSELEEAAAKLAQPDAYLYEFSRLLYSATKKGRRNPLSTAPSLKPLYQAVCSSTMKILAWQQKRVSAESATPAEKERLYETERVLLSIINEMHQTVASLYIKEPQMDIYTLIDSISQMQQDAYQAEFEQSPKAKKGGTRDKKPESTFFSYLQQTSADEKVSLLRLTILPFLYQAKKPPSLQHLTQSPIYKMVTGTPGLTLPYFSNAYLQAKQSVIRDLAIRLSAKPNKDMEAFAAPTFDPNDSIEVFATKYSELLDRIPDVAAAELEKLIDSILSSSDQSLNHSIIAENIWPLFKALIMQDSFTLSEKFYWLLKQSDPFTRSELEPLATAIHLVRCLNGKVDNLLPLITGATIHKPYPPEQIHGVTTILREQSPWEREFGSRAYANALTAFVEYTTLKDPKGNWNAAHCEAIHKMLLNFPDETFWNAVLKRNLNEIKADKHSFLHLTEVLKICLSCLDMPQFSSPANIGLFHKLLTKHILLSSTPLDGLEDDSMHTHLTNSFLNNLTPQEVNECCIEELFTALISKGLNAEHPLAKKLANAGVPAYLIALEPAFPKLAKKLSQLFPDEYAHLSDLTNGRENITTAQVEHLQWIDSQRPLFQENSKTLTPPLSQPDQLYTETCNAAFRDAQAAFEQAVQRYTTKAANSTTERLQEQFTILQDTCKKILSEREIASSRAAEQRDKALQTISTNRHTLEEIKLAWQAANNDFKADCSKHRRKIEMRKEAIDAEEAQALAAFKKVIDRAEDAAKTSEPLDGTKIKGEIEFLRQQAEGRVSQAVVGMLDQMGDSKRDLEGKVDRLRAAKKKQKQELQEAYREIERLKNMLLAGQGNIGKKEVAETEWHHAATQPELIKGIEEQIGRLRAAHGEKTVLFTTKGGKAVTPAGIDKKFREYAGNPTKTTLIALYEGCGITQTNQEGSHKKYQFVLDNGNVLVDGSDTVAAHGDELCPRAIIEGLRMTAAVLEHFSSTSRHM